MSSKKEEGAILIITLWILAILTVLSVGVAGRMGLELKLTGFYRDNMKALYLAKAAINRAISEKERDETPTVDILNEPWANNKDLFDKKNPFVIISENNETTNTYYTVKYTYKETKEDEGTDLYGMMDEMSKININKIVKDDNNTVEQGIKAQFLWLLVNVGGLTDSEALYKVNALIDWIDANLEPQEAGSDTEDYANIYPGFGPKKRLESVEELLLIKGFDLIVLYGSEEQGKYGIIDYVTIYTKDNKVNVNTSPKEVLQALGFAPDRAQDIINFRNNGGKAGETVNQPIINLSDLKNESFYSRQFDAGEGQAIANIVDNYLSTGSETFRIYATGKVNKVEKHITCVALIETGNATFKYWNEN